jgi:dolichol-phosphate mannosyltransferase
LNIAAVIPCYRVHNKILSVLAQMPAVVKHIICVDDACPDGSADIVEQHCTDDRVIVLRHEQNKGVGGAMITGYRAALKTGADIVVKVDGDGQMDPKFIPQLVRPILEGEADYVKGNRFFLLENLEGMPAMRLLGNAVLSFMSKLSTGYWRIFDPTNGFTAIHARTLALIPLQKLNPRYFFESDILFRLAILRAVVKDMPQRAIYADESSGIKLPRIVPQFLWLHSRNFIKRIFYSYYLRDFHLASIEWVLGPVLFMFGVIYGANAWYDSSASHVNTPAGTVMLSGLPVIIGLQLTLSAIGFDVDNQPVSPLQNQLVEDDQQSH